MRRLSCLLLLSLLPLAAACGENPGARLLSELPPADMGSPQEDMEDPQDLTQPDAAPDAQDLSPEEDLADADSPSAYVGPAVWEVHVSPQAPEAVQWAAQDLEKYLGLMGLEVTLVQSQEPVSCQPGLGVALVTGDGLEPVALPEEATGQTWAIEEARCEQGTLVALGGGGLLGRQYAAYEWLHGLGVRFFHPEQEFVPAAPAWPQAPLSRWDTPDFRDRSVSLHLTHPLELGDPWRLGDEQYSEEVRRYIDWEIKNLASQGKDGFGEGELRGYGQRRGFPRSAGFSLHNQQQGGRPIVDPDDPRSEEEQIAAAIDERMGDDPALWPEFFGFTFNPSEFTEINDLDAVRQLTFIAEYMEEHYPGVTVHCINHGTAGPPTENYGVRYYDLPQFAPENLGVRVHTLMFYDLFRPAPVYGNQDFNYLYDFMAQEYQDRELWYFPESAWWLTFDIAVPLYLPITLEARHRDIQGIKFMLQGKLRGHHVFGSGHEWGYWQNEYCSFRMAADTNMSLRQCLEDITSPMGPEAAPHVVEALERVISLQERDIIYGDLLPYLVGTDPETEVAMLAGIVFHELPPAVPGILQWDAQQVQRWRARIEPGLDQMAQDYAQVVEQLEAVRGQVPQEGLPWFDEIVDGVEVTGLRARHALHVYGSLVLLRQSQLEQDDARRREARRWLDRGLADTLAALAVVARREQGYRYQPLSRSIAGGPEGDQDQNWTIYRYRYLNRTHHAYYYTRIDRMAEQAFLGRPAEVDLPDALIGPQEVLALDVVDPTLLDPSLDPGDGTEPLAGRSLRHAYGEPGIYTARAEASREGQEEPFVFEAQVAALSEELHTGFTGRIAEPAGVGLIDPLLPALVVGRAGDGDLVLGYDLTGRGTVNVGQWQALEDDSPEGGLRSAAAPLMIPVVNRATGQIQATMLVEDAVVQRQGEQLQLTGALSTDAVIAALVQIGGFEDVGARQLVASTLGYTPETLPLTVPFLVEFAVEP